MYGEPLTGSNVAWLLSQTLCYLRHLQLEGKAATADGSDERWRLSR